MPTSPSSAVSPPLGMLAWPSYVLGLLHRDARASVQTSLGEAGLALSEFATLSYIDALDAASQQDVADLGRIDRSDLVKILDQLEMRKLITRSRHPDDRRRHVLGLTAAGRRALARGTAASLSGTAQAFSALTEAELHTLHHLALKALGAGVVPDPS